MATSCHEEDYRRVVHQTGPARWIPNTGIEIIRPPVLEGPPQHVLFDFDGTLSLVREGWPEVMIPMMVEVLVAAGTKEPPESLRSLCADFVTNLTGKQTIYQMIRLAEEVARWGAKPEDPLVYKQMYLDRLMQRIAGRREGLRTGRVSPRDMLVPYALELLDALTERGATLYVASGTDEPHVLDEVRLLGLDRYFGRHVYGAKDDYKTFSKAQVIERILRENDLGGRRALGLRRRLRGNPRRQGRGRHCRGRGQRRGRTQRKARSLETRPLDRRRRRPRDPRLPRLVGPNRLFLERPLTAILWSLIGGYNWTVRQWRSKIV